MRLNTTSFLTEESYFDYFDPRFPKWLAIIMLVIGVIGNILSLIVFLSTQMKNNSVFTYLAYLSVVDLFVITLGLGDIIIISYFKFVIRNYSIYLCRLHTFMAYFSSHLSSFLLASVSIDRAISLNFLNLAKLYCVPRTVHKIVILNCILILAINSHSLFSRQLRTIAL